MRKIVITAVAAALLATSGCSVGNADPSPTATTQAANEAVWTEEFEDTEPATGQNIERGNPQADFGDELDVGDITVAARFNGSKTTDETATESGVKVRLLEIQIKNNGDSVLDASYSGLDSITTDEGSGRQLYDGSQVEPFFGQVGPGEKASVTLLVKLPKGAKTATATYTFSGPSVDGGPQYTVHFTGDVKSA